MFWLWFLVILDSSYKEREETRLLFYHKNLPGLPTIPLGKSFSNFIKIPLHIRCTPTVFFFGLPQPCFDSFYSDVKAMFSGSDVLTFMEKCSLIEALVLISNQFKNFEKQKTFINELVAPMIAEWTSEELKTCVNVFLFSFILNRIVCVVFHDETCFL